VLLAAVTVACVLLLPWPWKKTVLSVGLGPKFWPEIVTVDLTPPLVGEMLEMVGGSVTVNVFHDADELPRTVTFSGPLVAPTGT
jgi:hypothetical protein